MEASPGRVDLSLFKLWSQGVGWGHNVGWEGCGINIGIYGEKSLKTHLLRKAVTLEKAISDKVDSNSFKSKFEE